MLYNLKKNKLNEIFIPIFNFHFKNLLIFPFLFLALFFNSQEQLEISLIIQGNYEQNLLFNEFYTDPSKIIINDNEITCENRKYCNCNRELNNVKIGEAVLNKFEEELSDIANTEKKPHLEGKNMFLILAKK